VALFFAPSPEVAAYIFELLINSFLFFFEYMSDPYTRPHERNMQEAKAMHNESIRYLIVPGWQGSADDHWQTHWQNSLPNSVRVEQADWLKPRREDWVGELQRVIASDSSPVILIGPQPGLRDRRPLGAAGATGESASGARRPAGGPR
jgi:hypothetical protein